MSHKECKMWSSDRTTLQLAVAHMRKWLNDLDYMVEEGHGNIGIDEIKDCLNTINEQLTKLNKIEGKARSLQVPPSEIPTPTY